MNDGDLPANLPSRKYPNFRKIIEDRIKTHEAEMKSLADMQSLYSDLTAMLERNGFDTYVDVHVYSTSITLSMKVDRTQWFKDRALPVIYALERLMAPNKALVNFSNYDNKITASWWNLNTGIYLNITIDGENGCQDITVTYKERTTTYREREYHIASRELKKILKGE